MKKVNLFLKKIYSIIDDKEKSFKIFNDFYLTDLLGKGTFGTVYLAYDKKFIYKNKKKSKRKKICIKKILQKFSS